MGLPREQRVSDLLHSIADLVQEADQFLDESALFQSRLPKPRKPRKPTNKDKGPGDKLRHPGVEPFKLSSADNSVRNTEEKLNKPGREFMRARRARKERARYQATKRTGTPRKSLGTRLRLR